MKRDSILVVEDDLEMRRFLDEELRHAGYEVVVAARGEEALHHLSIAPVDMVVTDVMMPGIKGHELLVEIRNRLPDIPVVIITAFGSIGSAVDAIKAGAYHYVAKPFSIEQLLATIVGALRERQLRQEIQDLRDQVRVGDREIVAVSSGMKGALSMVARAASADSPVLLLGESGTGKELLARGLHLQSNRKNGPYVPVNCSAIPDTILESHLFGHRRGAFTDAREDRRGLIQEADGGTLLLDEIGDMPTLLQAKLLRVIQEREVHPLGAPAPVSVDVRVVAATHRDLATLISEGRFREDLYYRLNVIVIRIPPLRERPDDLIPLIAHFLEKHGRRKGNASVTVTPEVLEVFRRYSWPGNVRELGNVLEQAIVLGGDKPIKLENLPAALRGPATRPASESVGTLSELERDHILRALRTTRGNKTAAARLLGLNRKTLYRKIEQFHIEEN
jgi:two-component system, NtrC family, response regulator AtoC